MGVQLRVFEMIALYKMLLHYTTDEGTHFFPDFKPVVGLVSLPPPSNIF